MAVPPQRPVYAPTPPPRGQNGFLAGLAAVALVGLTVMAVVVTVLAIRVLDTQRDVDRAAARFERSSRDLGPTIDDLRDAAKALRETNQAQRQVAP